jgi:prepilin signal peptidase PulO-like enzyme (type II secretory pathway)
MLDPRAILAVDDPAGTRLPVAIVSAEAGAATGVASAQRAARIAAEARWSRYLLWAVLLIAVAGLGWMAWRLALQLRRVPTPPEAPPDGG